MSLPCGSVSELGWEGGMLRPQGSSAVESLADGTCGFVSVVTWGLAVAKQKVLEAAGCVGQGAQT